jgi:hypothetical protein
VLDRALKGYIAPLPIGATQSTSSTDKFTALEPIDIFDAFISGSENFKDIGVRLGKFAIQNKVASELVSSFEKSGDPFSAAKAAYSASIKGTGTLQFKTSKGTSLNLYSPTTFEQGSSLSHVDLTNSARPV